MRELTTSKTIIGIDLGTTNSCMAVMKNGRPTIIPTTEGARSVPSVVAITEKGKVITGDLAKVQAATNTQGTFFLKKKILGSESKIAVGDTEFTSEEIFAVLLQNLFEKLKIDAENYLKEKVTEVVIGVPTCMLEHQYVPIEEAAKAVGLEVVRVVNDSMLTALAYSFEHNYREEERILIFDLGGGTLSISVVELGDGMVVPLSVTGENTLGGNEFDEKILEYVLEEFKEREGIDLSADVIALQRIREAAERAKIELSSSTATNIEVPFVIEAHDGWKHINIELTRRKFEELIKKLLKKMAHQVKRALSEAGMNVEDTSQKLNKVLVAGESVRVPAIGKMLEKITGKKVSWKVNPAESVALGAAIQGGKLGGVKETENILMLDALSLSLAIETRDGVATKIIPRNNIIPKEQSLLVSTVKDNQRAIDISIVQGERAFTKDNTLISIFRIVGIPSAPKGIPQIKVTFHIDQNRKLDVSAANLEGEGELKVTKISNFSKVGRESFPFVIKKIGEQESSLHSRQVEEEGSFYCDEEVEDLQHSNRNKKEVEDDHLIKILPVFDK